MGRKLVLARSEAAAEAAETVMSMQAAQAGIETQLMAELRQRGVASPTAGETAISRHVAAIASEQSAHRLTQATHRPMLAVCPVVTDWILPCSSTNLPLFSP